MPTSFLIAVSGFLICEKIMSITAIFLAQNPWGPGEDNAQSEIPFIDDSFSRPEGHIPPEVYARLIHLFEPSQQESEPGSGQAATAPYRGWVRKAIDKLKRFLNR